MNHKTPIAIFTYNRPKHVRQLFESLLECSRLDECAVYIFCDGAKKPEHQQAVLGSREVVHEFSSRLKANVIEQEQNVGLARSIVHGVTDLCGQYGRVIVLEDDLILQSFFLNFMLQSLERYEFVDRVAQVAGFTFPINIPAKPDVLFLPLTTSWGWATWKRAWDLFSWDLDGAITTLNIHPDICSSFDLDGAYGYSEMLRLTHEGKLDTWDIQWYWQTFSMNKLTLYPRRSLVWQNGFDESATHTTSAKPDLQVSINEFQQSNWNSPISFPEIVQTDKITFEKLKSFLRKKRSRSLFVCLKELLTGALTWLEN